MQPDYHSTSSASTIIIDEHGSLNRFYTLTQQLSKTRHVRFIGKSDEADNIEWHFKYRRSELILQYNIYSGVSLYTENVKDAPKVNKIADKLKSVAA